MSTLASSIISDAYRESNLIPMGNSPNVNQVTEALGRLNTLISSTIGNEAGDGFSDLNIGGTYDETWETSYYVPNNVRLILNLSGARSLNLHPKPFDGQRLSVVDTAGNLATYNLTLNGNGRNIEGAPSLVLNTNGDNRQWFYRADLGEWLKLNTLASTDVIPFPEEFDDYFITMLAMRVNPRYGQSITAETNEALKRARKQLRSRYLVQKRLSPDYDGRGLMNDPNYAFDPTLDEFETGRAYLWR